ncbi:septum formation family protein [Micromonospora fluostatini]|uniref:septum formation family protein n=1 Tax=Micromonospora sp. JCM 30529 TaxID=3421643 RepID=UPI003D16FDEC
MRRWLRAVVATALVAAVLTGFGAPTGTDGDLTDDWLPVAEAERFVARAGDCHALVEPTSRLASYRPVDCARPHLAETFHVGTFTGATARREHPPEAGSAALRATFTECDRRARDFVGGDWRGGRLSVQATPTSPVGWAGGSRWYRCDLFVLDEVHGVNGDSDSAVPYSGSLRGALTGDSPVRLTCFDEDEGRLLRQAPCAGPHRFEYAGTWTAPDGWHGEVDRDEETVHTRCRQVIARYARVPVDDELRYRTGSAYRLPSAQAWARGDRGVRCFFWSGGRPLTGSVRGGGPAVLPVN